MSFRDLPAIALPNAPASNIGAPRERTRHTAQAVVHAMGITDLRSEVLPEDKSVSITDRQRMDGTAARVGDGVNDSEAFAQADLGIAMDVALDLRLHRPQCDPTNLRMVPKAM